MNTSKRYTNALIHESSPYLLQHAHNPVNWFPWGDVALNKAKKENKLILISIGYAACHWCHVMAHESFENEEVAAYMNAHFVAIKVDREERPDIDQIYMNAVQIILGSGGWPLNCIALPDGRPIYGGTYYTTTQWLDVMQQVVLFAHDYPDKMEHQANSITAGIQASELVQVNPETPLFSLDDLHAIFDFWKKTIDVVHGGRRGAPKFPLPVGYQFLLHYFFLTKNAEAHEAVHLTLQKMADGGIYDQVGGGFSRYSVDAIWKAPHFEKMLYDNAQLVSLFAAAYQQSKNPHYKAIITETLAFVKRELSSDLGAFYASLDADSEGEEGRFYVWKQHELISILGKDAALVMDYYNVKEKGNWEKFQNILYKTEEKSVFVEKYQITEAALDDIMAEAKDALLAVRAKRPRPELDDKHLTSWNALMLKAYVEAYVALGEEDYLAIAIKNAHFITTELMETDCRLWRSYKDGKASINAYLDDYTFTISAFIALYQATFVESYLEEAKQLTTYVIAHFYDQDSGMFYYTSDLDPQLIARKTEVVDNVIPSSNSEMAKNLFVLGTYFHQEEYVMMAQKMVNNVKRNALQGGAYYANWDILMSWLVNPPLEVAILGADVEKQRQAFGQYYLPYVFFSGGKDAGRLALHEGKMVHGQTTIYVCKNKTCQLPVVSFEEALAQILP